MSVVERVVRTSHADMAVAETSGGKLPLVLIHGNSSCKEVFRHQLKSPVGETYRLIAVDLPGHGRSSDARDPENTYTMPGYAEAVVELLHAMKIKQAAVFGWSLGGHVGLEMLPRFPGLVGLMITGAPPVGNTPEAVMAGFRPNEHAALLGKPELAPEELQILLAANYGGHADALLTSAARRTDGRARAIMFGGLFTGRLSDQRAIAESTTVPIALVNGADDPVVNADYVGSLHYKALWDEHGYILRGLSHAPFLQAPDVFNPILGRFMQDMQARAAANFKPGPRRASVVAAA
jgi:pimeloyl-ACP methyl ester carboxylesterase